MRLRLTNTEMKDFRRCRRKWYLGVYRRLTSRANDKPGSAFAIGNLVHDCLAVYYTPDNPVNPIDHLEAVFLKQVESSPAEEDALRTDRDLVRVMLEGYLQWLAEEGADSDLRLLGAETAVEVPIRDLAGNELGFSLLSKLDAPVERKSSGAKLALEHKSVGVFKVPEELKIDTQLLTEHLARFLDAIERGATPEEAYNSCTGVVYNMLRKSMRTSRAKPPFYGRIDVTHNIHELRNHWRHVVAIAVEIQATTARLDAGESHHTACPPTPIPDRCKWECAFFRVCVLADDREDSKNFEGALAAMYVEHDPLERYRDSSEF